ncbi:MAG: hypothetical protein ONB16_06300 [candidate division KSB1 bacterium]|nr:hypothetical protein [candidate division KSB1 bacterium]
MTHPIIKKSIQIIVGLLAVQLFIISFLLAQHSRRTDIESKAWAYLKNYSPNSYYLLNAFYNAPKEYRFGDITITLGPKTSFLDYIDGDSDHDIVASLNTVVHEMCHAFAGTMTYFYLQQQPDVQLGFGDSYSLFFVDSSRSILVPHTEIFPTREIHPIVPKKFQTMRYETYIYPSNKIGSQVHGIYGLLDEWFAYYHGTRTDIDLFDYYAAAAQDQPGRWLDFFAAVNGTYYAHLEFKFYSLKYLLYAQEHHPDIYHQIIANQNFIDAFNAIDSCFSALNQKYFKLKEDIFQQLAAKGIKCSHDEKYDYVGLSGRGNFLETYNLLDQELGQSEYQSVLSTIQAAANDKK